MANRNDGYPSYDHSLKHSTSLVDLRWSALRIGFRLDPSTMQRPDEIRSTPTRSKLPSRIFDQSSDDPQH